MSDDSDQEEGHRLDIDEQDDAATSQAPSLYAILGVRSDADAAAIRKAFLTLSGAYHTDKHALQSEEVQGMMNSRFQQLTEAYEVLSNPRSRAAYDGSGAHWQSRLELVPVTHQTPADVRRYIDVLEAEAESKRVAGLLSSSSSTNLEVSAAHWFSASSVQKNLVKRREDGPRLADEFKRPQPSSGDEGATATHSSGNLSEEPKSAEVPADAPTSPSGSPSGSATLAAAPMASQGIEPSATDTPPAAAHPPQAAALSNLDVMQIEINGQPQFVAVLPPSIQEQLRNSPQVQQSMGAGVGGAAMGGTSTPPKRKGILSSLFVVHSLSGSYAFNHPVSPSSILSFKGDCSHNRRGGSNSLTVAYTKVWALSKVGASLKASMTGFEYRFKWSRALTALTSLAMNYNFKQLTATLTRKLSAATTMVNSLVLTGADEGGSFSTSLQHVVSSKQHLAGEVSMGFGSLAVTASHVFLPYPHIKVTQTVATQLLSGRTYLNYEVTWIKSKLNHLGVRISTTLPCSVSPLGGILWAEPSLSMNQVSLTYARGDHSLSIPIILCVSDKVSRSLQVFGVPLAIYGVGRLVLQPVLRLNRLKEVRRIRAAALSEVEAARGRCKLEMLALYASIHKRKAHEAGTDGLIIRSAIYGVLPPSVLTQPTDSDLSAAPQEPDYPTLDVTDALQNLVHDSRLELAAGPKTHLPGIADIDPGTGEPRKLCIHYTYRGQDHVAVVAEGDAISLPDEAHLSAA